MTGESPSTKLTPEHLLTLYQISGHINSTLDFDQALNNVIDAVMDVTQAERGFLVIRTDDNEDSMKVLVARGIDGATIEAEGYSTTIVNQVTTSRQPLLTNNAQLDTRFEPGESIIMRKLRAILCAPMLVQDRLIGVVYVDTSMRSGAFHDDDRDLLMAVSGMAARAIENARLYQVAIEKGRLEHELQTARFIQESLLPVAVPELAGYEVMPHWEAAREMAGDFYDIFMLDDQSLATVVADVSDKGAPAALFMAITRTLLRTHTRSGVSSVDAVKQTNDMLLQDAEKSGMFVTLMLSTFEVGGMSRHVCAGHNPPAVYRAAQGEVEYMPRGGRALGWFPDNPLAEHRIQLKPGDCVVIFTDGLTEAENVAGDFYGEERLARVIKDYAHQSVQEIKAGILRDVHYFTGDHALADDLTLMIIKYTGTA